MVVPGPGQLDPLATEAQPQRRTASLGSAKTGGERPSGTVSGAGVVGVVSGAGVAQPLTTVPITNKINNKYVIRFIMFPPFNIVKFLIYAWPFYIFNLHL